MAELSKETGASAEDDELWAKRAAFYGLDIKEAWREPLVVAEGEIVKLTPRPNGGGRFDRHLKQVPVRELAELKRLIGTPDAVVRAHGCCGELPAESVPPAFKSLDELDGEQHRALYAASHAYLYGDSARVAHHAPALERAFELDKRHNIGVFLLQDLIVERNATVILGGSLNVALFRHVIIRRNGRLRIEKNMKIDCVSIRGEGLFNARVFDRDGVAAAVVKALKS